MKHSQKHRGKTIVIHAEHRERRYWWRFAVEGLPFISGSGVTLDGDVQGNALQQAMLAARLAIDQTRAGSAARTAEDYRGSVSRGIAFGRSVDEKTVANLKEGVLRLTPPKREGIAGCTPKIG
jgi:hypothetical protein